MEKREHKAHRETKYGKWEEGDASLFWVRSGTFKEDGTKVQSAGPVMRLIHLDLFQGPTEQIHIFPKVRHRIPPDVGLLNSEREFYFILNILIRGKDRTIDKKKKLKSETWINWVFYFALPHGARKDPSNAAFFKCFDHFLKGNDKERNHRLKVIPCVAEGPWIVRAAIGGGKESHKGVTPTLIGEKVTTSYFEGHDYLEMDCNTAIDAVAVTSAKLAIQHSQKLVVDAGVVIQGESDDELPEKLLGVARCSNFIISEADLFPGTDEESFPYDRDE
jgi:hypothetical protein